MRDVHNAIVTAYHREVRAYRILMLACRLGALGFIGLYFYLGIGLGIRDVFYISLNLASIQHRHRLLGLCRIASRAPSFSPPKRELMDPSKSVTTGYGEYVRRTYLSV